MSDTCRVSIARCNSSRVSVEPTAPVATAARTMQFVWNVEDTTHHALDTTRYTTINTHVFLNKNASLGVCAGVCIEVQYEHAEQGGDVF